MNRVKQDKNKEIRYTRNSDFTDEVVDEFFNRDYVIKDTIKEYPKLLKPFFY